MEPSFLEAEESFTFQSEDLSQSDEGESIGPSEFSVTVEDDPYFKPKNYNTKKKVKKRKIKTISLNSTASVHTSTIHESTDLPVEQSTTETPSQIINNIVEQHTDLPKTYQKIEGIVLQNILFYYLKTYRGKEQQVIESLLAKLADFKYVPNNVEIPIGSFICYMPKKFVMNNLRAGGYVVQKYDSSRLRIWQQNSERCRVVNTCNNFVFINTNVPRLAEDQCKKHTIVPRISKKSAKPKIRMLNANNYKNKTVQEALKDSKKPKINVVLEE